MCVNGETEVMARTRGACIWIFNERSLSCLFLWANVHHVSKNRAELFLSELRQISTNFDNFWQKDGTEAKIMWGALIFHLI